MLGVVYLLYGAGGTYQWVPVTWGVGIIAFAVGALLNAWAGQLPDFVILVVSNLLMQGALVLLWSGTSSFMQTGRSVWPFIAFSVVALMTVLVFVYLYPSQQMRILLFSGMVAIGSYDSGRMLLTDRSTPNLILGGMLIMVGFLYSLRLLGSLAAPWFPEWFTTEVLLNGYGIMTLAVFIFWAVGMLAVTALRSERELKAIVEQLRVMALTDQLTQLRNRRYMHQRLDEALFQLRQSGDAFSVLFVDADDFKLINDTYGHDCGDLVLQGIAQVLRANFGCENDLARWGGEEFFVLLIGIDEEQAILMAERLREAVSALSFPFGDALFRITITIGGATARNDWSVAELIRRADRALYAGKRNGRNRIEWDDHIPRQLTFDGSQR